MSRLRHDDQGCPLDHLGHFPGDLGRRDGIALPDEHQGRDLDAWKVGRESARAMMARCCRP